MQIWPLPTHSLPVMPRGGLAHCNYRRRRRRSRANSASFNGPIKTADAGGRRARAARKNGANRGRKEEREGVSVPRPDGITPNLSHCTLACKLGKETDSLVKGEHKDPMARGSFRCVPSRCSLRAESATCWLGGGKGRVRCESFVARRTRRLTRK